MKHVGLICLVCAAFLLVGCRGKEMEGENAKSGSPIQFQQMGDEAGDSGLNVLIMHAEVEEGLWKGWGAKKLSEDLGITLNFFPTSTNVNREMYQYLMAGQLPDILTMGGEETIQLYLDAGVLLPLDGYKEQLPNIFKDKSYKDALQYIRDHRSNGTGQVYLLPTAVGPTDYHSFNWVPLLQWDAYKKVGMPKIRTLEDYLDVVEQMVAYKPVTEDGEKVYGFSLFSEWDDMAATEISTLSYMYGIDTRYVSPLMETNLLTKTTSSLLAEDSFYKRALKFYFEANQRGLLDPDSMTQKYSDMEEKLSSGRVMFSWFSWMYGNYNSESNQNDEHNPDGMASVVAEDMKLYQAPDKTIGSETFFGVIKNSENIKTALNFLNWLYDPEVQRYLTNGPEGVTWEYNKEGEPGIIQWDILNNPDEDIMPEAAGGGAFNDGRDIFGELGLEAATEMKDGYSLSYRYWPSTLDRNPTRMDREVEEMLGGQSLSEYLYANDMVAEATQAVNMVQTPGVELQSKINHIGEVVKKFSWQMVYAATEDEFENLWRIMTDTAEKLGMSEIVAYYTEKWEEALRLVEKYDNN